VTDACTLDPGASRGPRVWTLSVDGNLVDVEVTARETDRLSDLLPALASTLGRPVTALWAASARLADDAPLTAPELGHGAMLGVGRPIAGSERGRRSSALELHVVGGPDAGRTVPLGQGRHVLGRSSHASVLLEDPDVSRQHVAVQVGGGTITVADLRSTNGSRLDEVELDERPRAWSTGAILRLGASAVTVSGPDGGTAALEPGAAGRVRLRPTSRMGTPASEVEVSLPRPPAAPPRRRLAWVAVALPAIGGVLMAWLLHTPTFLFFALLSPVVALGTWLSERWSGRRSGRRDAAAHTLEVAAAQTRLAEAVRTDVRAAEAAHPDLAALTTSARRRSHLLWSRSRAAADALTVRVGSGPGSTRVTRIQADGTRTRETAPHLPVVIDLRAGGGLAVVGPRERTVGVLATLVAQLTALHPPGELDLLLLAEAGRLRDWEWARWLPHLDPGAVHVRFADAPVERDDALHSWLTALTARRRTVAERRSGQPDAAAAPGWLVVLVDRALDPRITASLRAARDVGVVPVAVAESVEDVPVAVGAVLRLTGETGDVAVLSRQGTPDRIDVVVDRLPRGTAAAFARDLAGLTPVTSGSSLPQGVRLFDLPTAGLGIDSDGGVRGSWLPGRDRLVTTLGRTAHGLLQIDLCREGPHALIAGTTGSGKSELLQTLIAGLALHHPPDRCSFLLVDYKGGAAFAEAATLPHTVGLVTDLDGQATARALRSLSAELTRREAVLSTYEVADIAALPDEVELARLVIVVDEFATLAEELPSFVPGLIAIAQRGRSLGVHLVLATQRPSGVVSPEIRANCTLRICLRTTDEADSRDVLGTTEAAHLPVSLPGRAFVRSGSGTPTALQVARVSTSAAHRSDAEPAVRLWAWPSTPVGTTDDAAPDGETDLSRLCRAVTRHAEETGTPAPHRPWRPPLPDHLHVTGLEELTPGNAPEDAADRDRLSIGLIDRPDKQSRERLELDLAEGGTWLAVGGPRSGRTTLLRTVLGEAVHRWGPDELHVHVLESGGGSLATEAAALQHTGTAVSGEDALRTVRLVDRLGREVAARRAGAASGREPLILLLIDGVESISTLLDEADPGRGSAALLRLLRDGAAVGLTCVLTADRAVPGGRLAAVARHRFLLPLPDRADYAVAGIAARDVPSFRPPGRALFGEEALECQLALPRLAEPAAASTRPFPSPLRIVDLPPDPWLTVPQDRTGPRETSSEGRVLSLPIGPGGDEGDPLAVDLVRTGGLLVSGPPGSGRSTALDAFAPHLSALGGVVLRLGPHLTAADAAGSACGAFWLDPGDEAGMRDWVAGLTGRLGVVIADDVGPPGEWPALTALPTLGARTGLVLVAAGSPGQLSSHYQGPVATLRRGRTGLLLSPGPGDADLLGVRLPRTPLPVRPGSGWLITGAGMERVQVARRRMSAASTPLPAPAQSRSSAGPISCVAYQASS
jgi:S-DNA-T family DNA segregation ATPase FtsK/SpoIIIE